MDFERQELRAIFEAMDKNNVFYRMLGENQIVSAIRPIKPTLLMICTRLDSRIVHRYHRQ